MHPIHNLQLDRICLDLYDFPHRNKVPPRGAEGKPPFGDYGWLGFSCGKPVDEMRPVHDFFRLISASVCRY
jgi:hypothetical protein